MTSTSSRTRSLDLRARLLDLLAAWVSLLMQLYLLTGLYWINWIKDFFKPFYHALFDRPLPLVLRTPEEKFSHLHYVQYEFEPHYVSLSAGFEVTFPRMHYVDEGPRDARFTILCLHGEPTWSFLYRKMIPGLVDQGYRVIAPDFIGFGKSDKFSSADNYTHEMHTMSLRMLIEHLQLRQNIILVSQGWGGLVGMSVVKDAPEKFSHLVIMNTALPTGQWIDDDVKNSGGKLCASIKRLYKGLPFLTWLWLTRILGQKFPLGLIFDVIECWPQEVARAYKAPYPDHTYMAGVTKWPLLVPTTAAAAIAPHMVEARKELKNWRKPVLTIFGSNDVLTQGEDKVFKSLVPHATQVTIKDGGHFLQETHGEDVTDHIINFLAKPTANSTRENSAS